MTKKETGLPFYMDGLLVDNLNLMKLAISKHWDMCGIVDGLEGSGKSTIAAQCAYCVDPTINLSRCCMDNEEFIEAVINAKPGQAIILDEAYSSLSSVGSTSKINREVVEMLQRVRQKNLFIVLVLPSFYMLQKYAAIFRSQYLIHVDREEDWNRGTFWFYNDSSKKRMYIDNYKYMDYDKKLSNFPGSFTSWLPWTKEEYEKKKERYMVIALKNSKKLNSYVSNLYHSSYWTGKVEDMESVFNVSRSSLYMILELKSKIQNKYINPSSGGENV